MATQAHKYPNKMIVKLLNRDQINSSKKYRHLEYGSFIVSIFGNEKDVYQIADATGDFWFALQPFNHEHTVEAIFTMCDEKSASALICKISELCNKVPNIYLQRL